VYRSLVVALPAALVLVAAPASAQTSGAIFTRDSTGATVNGNVYALKEDVYLAAGPGPNSPCSAAGVPDGPYYFQVTDPSGEVLLSKDLVTDRMVLVQNGVLSQHKGKHLLGTGPCSSATVQLVPFADTKDHDEYKVWLTPVAHYDPYGGGSYGFLPRFSKTDNFKVHSGGASVPQSSIHGSVFFDHSEDGIWNPGTDPLEVPVAGWRIELLLNGVVDGVTFTDESGGYLFLRDLDQTVYTVREIAAGGFIGDNVPGAIWLAMTPRSGSVAADTEVVTGPDFGILSFEVRVGLGRTKGFWHNQNGRAVLLANDPAWRDALTTRGGTPICLRRNLSSADPLVSVFAPLPQPATFQAAYDDFAQWIVGDSTTGHASFILAAQVAATILNHRFGFLQFTVYVDEHRDGLLVSLEDLIEHGTHVLLCDPLAGLTGPHDEAGAALREHMLECINEFGGVNNTGDPTAPQVVFGKSSLPLAFSSPYGG
jgi:hypothetical protein